jgi:hypothetical protein
VQLKALFDVYNRELSELAAGIYIDMLRREPASVIPAAVRRHIETSKWFPQPSELLDLCRELRWPLEVELENAQAEVEWTKNPAFGRTKAQLMAERRVMYGEYATAEDTEWMLWHLGTAPPVPPPPEHLSDEARAAIEMQTRAEWKAEQQRLAAALNLKQHKGLAELADTREILERQAAEEWQRRRRPVSPPAAAPSVRQGRPETDGKH